MWLSYLVLAQFLSTGTMAADAVHPASRPHQGGTFPLGIIKGSIHLEDGLVISQAYESGLHNGRYCIIVGYSENGGSNDTAMALVWKYYRAISAKNVIGVKSRGEFLRALKACPIGTDVILDTHGFGESDGGFCLFPGECFGPGDVDQIASNLIGVKNIHIWACAVAEGAIHKDRAEANFASRLVNIMLEKTIAARPELKGQYRPLVWAYSRNMFSMGDRGFGSGPTAKKSPDTHEVVFCPDAQADERTGTEAHAFIGLPAVSQHTNRIPSPPQEPASRPKQILPPPTRLEPKPENTKPFFYGMPSVSQHTNRIR